MTTEEFLIVEGIRAEARAAHDPKQGTRLRGLANKVERLVAHDREVAEKAFRGAIDGVRSCSGESADALLQAGFRRSPVPPETDEEN